MNSMCACRQFYFLLLIIVIFLYFFVVNKEFIASTGISVGRQSFDCNFTHYIKDDIDRIIIILNKDSTLEFGVCTFYIDNRYEKGNAKEKLLKKIEKIIEEIKKYLENSSLAIDWKYKLIYEEKEDKDTAYSVCIMIKK